MDKATNPLIKQSTQQSKCFQHLDFFALRFSQVMSGARIASPRHVALGVEALTAMDVITLSLPGASPTVPGVARKQGPRAAVLAIIAKPNL